MKSFKTKAEAFTWMEEFVDDGCIDNYRIAELGNAHEEKIYDLDREDGCCGNFDTVVLIGEKQFKIGCNYGH